MPLLSRLENPSARFSGDDMVAQQRPELSCQNIGMFVFAMMTMQGRRQCARRQLVMNYREAATGLSTVNLPLRAEAPSVEFLARLERN